MNIVIEYHLWIKAVHIMAVISWMAGLFYLPRLFVYHVESTEAGLETGELFLTMERRLLKAIMTPAMIVSWIAGLLMATIPGLIDFGAFWSWGKIAAVIAMTLFHFWLLRCHRQFVAGQNTFSSRDFRIINEIPTVLMFIIVVAIVVRPI